MNPDPLAPTLEHSDPDRILERLIEIKVAEDALTAEKSALRERLSALAAAGEIEHSLEHQGWTFREQAGRLTTTYSPDAKAAIKGIQEADLAMGRAEQKRGAPTWVMTAPKF